MKKKKTILKEEEKDPKEIKKSDGDSESSSENNEQTNDTTNAETPEKETETSSGEEQNGENKNDEQADGQEEKPASEEKQLLTKFVGLLKQEGFKKRRSKTEFSYIYRRELKGFKEPTFIAIKINLPIINESVITFKDKVAYLIFEESEGKVIKINIEVKSNIPELSSYAFSDDDVEINPENCNTQQVKGLIEKLINAYRDVIPEDKEKYLKLSKSEKTDSANRKRELARSTIKEAFDKLSEEEQDALYDYFPKLSDFLMGGDEQ